MIKIYESAEGNDQEKKYSPAECTSCKKTKLTGDPNPKFVSTSYIERQNQTMRMHMRRFTRLTNAFSKKSENHGYAIALHFVYYNFAKIHKSLSVTPAMQAGLTKRLMKIENIALMAETQAPKKRGKYQKEYFILKIKTQVTCLKAEALPGYNDVKLSIFMNQAKHEMLFSVPRLNRYITACNGDAYKALSLYKYNIQACQALYPVISILEVALRNSLDRELIKHYGDSDWLINQRSDFADNPFLVYKDRYGKEQTDLFFKEKIEKAEKKLISRGANINHVKLLAELTFGFWVKFYDTSPIKILRGVPYQAFTNKPGVKGAKVHSHLNAIVALRNRISHNEAICFNRSGNLCLDTLRQYQFDIEDALRWLDGDLSSWAEKLNFYKPVVIRISQLA